MLSRSALALSLLASLALAAPRPIPQPEAPAWFGEHMSFLTEGGGRFVADNELHESPAEPFDAYGMEWTYGIGEMSVTGRLFGLKEGRELGTFWEFRTYFDPDSRRVRVLQFGADGTVGDGWLAPAEGSEAGALAAEQTFSSPDGTTREVRHESVDADDVHTTTSFQRTDGEWVRDRGYVWLRQ